MMDEAGSCIAAGKSFDRAAQGAFYYGYCTTIPRPDVPDQPASDPSRQGLLHSAGPAEPVVIQAADGFEIKGRIWRHAEAMDGERSVVIINPATSVACRYYARFAAFLFASNFDVVIYDYRGIGASRPLDLRGFNASWADWGRLDFEAVLQFAAQSFPGQPIDVVGHSVGGFLIGLAQSNHCIRRIFTMGAQYAYWRDYAAEHRLPMLIKWHVAMPLLTKIFGYFRECPECGGIAAQAI